MPKAGTDFPPNTQATAMPTNLSIALPLSPTSLCSTDYKDSDCQSSTRAARAPSMNVTPITTTNSRTDLWSSMKPTLKDRLVIEISIATTPRTTTTPAETFGSMTAGCFTPVSPQRLDVRMNLCGSEEINYCHEVTVDEMLQRILDTEAVSPCPTSFESEEEESFRSILQMPHEVDDEIQLFELDASAL